MTIRSTAATVPASGGFRAGFRSGPLRQYGHALLARVGAGPGAHAQLARADLLLAAAASLPPARFATGAAVLTMSRQLGIALGVAVLVAVLGTPAPGAVLDAFREGWAFQISAALLGAAAGLAMGVAGPAVSPLPAVPRGTAAGTQPG